MHSHYPRKIRIIGGKWRHRYIIVPPLPALRPTPNRIRETVFNWLAPSLRGADCLDLFAGSGALGFEALSRGAGHVTFVDQSSTVLTTLKKNADSLHASLGTFILGKFPYLLPLPKTTYDIIFLDPPFYHALIAPTLIWLETERLLKNGTLIYIETESQYTLPPLSSAFILRQSKKTRRLAYQLLEYRDSHPKITANTALRI